jgi:hypothetical protein
LLLCWNGPSAWSSKLPLVTFWFTLNFFCINFYSIVTHKIFLLSRFYSIPIFTYTIILKIFSALPHTQPENHRSQSASLPASKLADPANSVDFYVSSTDSETNIDEDERNKNKAKKPQLPTSRSKFSIGDDEEEGS